jgi:hypothetical protein
VPLLQEPEETFKKSKAPLADYVGEEVNRSVAPAQPHPIIEHRPVQIHRLPPHSYRLVDHLFANGRQPQGQVTFQDLGRFMAVLGFGQIALGGSEYRFFKAGDEAHRGQNIVFHRRHPDPAYRAIDLRWIGQRLSSSFGWTSKTFEAV